MNLFKSIGSNCNKIAHSYKLDFTKCVESAYNTIKDRKGKLVNGTYVKNEDLKNE
jgi:hypothetical protein